MNPPQELNATHESPDTPFPVTEQPQPTLPPTNSIYPSVPEVKSAQISIDTESSMSKTKKQRFGTPRAYLVEYLLSLALTGIIIGISISFLNSIVSPSEDASSWAAGYAYTASLLSLATILVALPSMLVLSKRCRNAERQDAVKGSSWRKGLLAVFLVLVSLNAVGAAIALVYSVMSLVMSFGLTDASIGMSLRSIGVSLFAMLVLTFTAVLYAQDYRNGKLPLLVERFHRYGLAALALLLTVLFVAIPLQSQRNAFSDRIKSNDISSLSVKIRDYETDNNRLPDNLDALDLSEGLDKRASSYEYSKSNGKFELCANFKTDTRVPSSSSNPLEAALSGSWGYDYVSTSTDPSRHDKGRQCFEYTSYSSRSSLRFDDLYNDDFFDDLDGADFQDSIDSESTLN